MKTCREDKSNFKEFIFDNSLSMYKKSRFSITMNRDYLMVLGYDYLKFRSIFPVRINS